MTWEMGGAADLVTSHIYMGQRGSGTPVAVVSSLQTRVRIGYEADITIVSRTFWMER